MIRRDTYLKKLEMYAQKDVVKIVTGVRRSGKTTLIRQFIEELTDEGVSEDNIIYLNFEGLAYSYFTEASALRDMLTAILADSEEHKFLFLDEVQTVAGWAEVAAECINLFDCDVYVISSNASVFRNDFAKVLNYRYVRIEVYPLTFSEYLQITADEYGHREEDGAFLKSRDELFADYLKRGSMPGVYHLKDGEDASGYLADLYQAILLKDVVQCNNLRDTAHIDKIMEYLLSHIGETFSPKAIRDSIRGRGVNISVDTIYSCLEALAGAYLIYKVPRFDIKANRVLETQEKYYICDPGMRNAVMRDGGFAGDGALENALCLEMLSRGFTLYVGKQGTSQIDFMAEKGENRTYLNCCSSVAEKEAVKEEFGPLTRIRDNYFKMVLTMDPETMVNKGGIMNYPLTGFLAPA